MFGEIAHVVVAKGEQKLTAGTDMNGKPLRPYSESYQEAIAKKQVFGKENPKLVNLSVTGDMRRARQVQDASQGVGSEVRFNSPEEANKAQFLHERGFVGWHGMGDEEVAYADKKVDELISELMTNLID